MMDEFWPTVHHAGKVRNIDVMVCQKAGEDQFKVVLCDTFEGLSVVGQTFPGPNGLRDATVQSNTIHAALEIASLTWEAMIEDEPRKG